MGECHSEESEWISTYKAVRDGHYVIICKFMSLLASFFKLHILVALVIYEVVAEITCFGPV